MPIPDQLLFLPGASGNTTFWHPVARLLPHPAARRHFGWPGFGATPADAGVRSLTDLVDRVEAEISVPTALIAQSMGGIVAVRAALRRPHRVTHLVLAATSGGVDVAGRGGEDWRPAFARANPSLPRWFLDDRSDITDDLQRLRTPALLLWGDADPISPVAVGRHLASLLPDARLHLVAGGDHDLAHARAGEVAPLIGRHLGLASAGSAGERVGRGKPQADAGGDDEGAVGQAGRQEELALQPLHQLGLPRAGLQQLHAGHRNTDTRADGGQTDQQGHCEGKKV